MSTADPLSSTLLSYIKHGTYPESEALSSATLTTSTLSSLQQALQAAQDSAKEEIRHLSREAAPDIDSWIARARTLQADILRSRSTAREIVAAHEASLAIDAEVEDHARKVELLEKEVGFNESLTGTLEHIRYANGLLERTQEEAVRGDVGKAIRRLEDAEASIEGLQSVDGSRTYSVLRERLEGLKESLRETTTECWDALVGVEFEERAFRPREGLEANVPDAVAEVLGLGDIVKGAQALEIFTPLLQKLGKDIDRTILKPRMVVEDGMVAKITITDDRLSISGQSEDLTSTALFKDLHSILHFISMHLPPTITTPLSSTLIALLTDRLQTHWLDPAIPLSMSGIPAFQTLLSETSTLADQIDNLGWHGSKALRDFVREAPARWLNRRRGDVLGRVRDAVLGEGLRERKVVERVETGVMSKQEASGMVGGGDEEDWDGAWDEPEDAKMDQKGLGKEDAEDEDASAWDLQDDEVDQKDDEGGDDEDAWGWGDGDEAETTTASSPPKQTSKAATQNRSPSAKPPPQNQELTLRETFTTTAIPDSLLHLLQTIVSDASKLTSPEHASSPIAPAARELYRLPTLALAVYRATASTAYAKIDVGNMLIYNDASHLADSLVAWQADQPEGSRLRLDADVAALQGFAKRAYGSEMESQRTVIRDLLDGAQGFRNSVLAPFKGECEGAVEAVVDRIRDVHGLWKGTLSQGALLQSLGSLLSTATNKIITEIEELGDISEAESKQLKLLCDKFGALIPLFSNTTDPSSPEHAGGGAGTDMTFVYSPSWLKFQYLAEILEASLADIRWMWKEGELKLEFETGEVVELVEALFSESELRRQAIWEIRS